MDDLGENTFQTTISQQGGASLKKKVMMDHGANDPKSQKPANEVSDQAKQDNFFYWLLFWFGRYANMETKWFTKSLITTSNSMRAGHHLPLALAAKEMDMSPTPQALQDCALAVPPSGRRREQAGRGAGGGL